MENQIFDIKKLERIGEYKKIDKNDMTEYINKIKFEKYDYEYDAYPDEDILEKDIQIAKIRLNERSNKFNIELKSNVFLDFNGKKIKILDGKIKDQNLTCSMDNRLLRRILDKNLIGIMLK